MGSFCPELSVNFANPRPPPKHQQPRVTLGAPGAGAPLARRAFDFIWCSTRSPGLRAHSCGRQLTRGTLILARQLARRAPPVSRGGASGAGRGLSRGAGPAESGSRTVAWGEDCRVGRDGARSGHTGAFRLSQQPPAPACSAVAPGKLESGRPPHGEFGSLCSSWT